MIKKCECCEEDYEPDYDDELLDSLSKFCKKCVAEKIGEFDKYQKDYIDDYNFTTPLKTDFGNPSCIVPGKDGEPLCRKGMVIDRDEFEKVKDEFYQIRGWDVATGLQTKDKLEELGLSDVAQRLEGEGLLVSKT